MSLRSHSLWEVLKSTFSREVWKEVCPATFDTLYMVFFAVLLTLLFGLFLGVVLTVTDKNGLYPSPMLNKILGGIINCMRSLPEVIMIIVMLPVARLILGKSYGSDACIIALSASCIPMFARLTQSALMELPKGKIEAARAMGAGNRKIIFSVLLPEAFPALVRSLTVAFIGIISMTALAGSFGAGGVGDIAVRYGFNRFQHDMLFATILVLIIMVQSVQLIGDFASKLILKKRHLI